MIVTVDNKGIMRSGIISVATYDIEELQFAISTTFVKDYEVYLSLYSVTNKLYDVVRLTPLRAYDATHTLYTLIPAQIIRVGNNERVIMKLIFLNKVKDQQVVSNSAECKLQTANYKFTRQIAIAQEVQLATADYFEKISEMYNKIMKGENRE